MDTLGSRQPLMSHRLPSNRIFPRRSFPTQILGIGLYSSIFISFTSRIEHKIFKVLQNFCLFLRKSLVLSTFFRKLTIFKKLYTQHEKIFLGESSFVSTLSSRIIRISQVLCGGSTLLRLGMDYRINIKRPCFFSLLLESALYYPYQVK